MVKKENQKGDNQRKHSQGASGSKFGNGEKGEKRDKCSAMEAVGQQWRKSSKKQKMEEKL